MFLKFNFQNRNTNVNAMKNIFTYKNLKLNFSSCTSVLEINSYYYSKNKISFINKNHIKYFCTKNSQGVSNNNERYFYEFESPESQEINLQTLGVRILKKLIIIASILTLIYYFLLRKYNNFAKRHQLYLINEYLDVKLSEYASEKIKKIFEHYIFRKDSEEVKLVYKIYEKILHENKINIQISPENVYVIDTISIGAFLFKNGDLFISERILEIAEKNEDEIALFIATEIASNLMGKTTSRILSYFYMENTLRKNENIKEISKTDFIGYKMNIFNKFNKYLYFYPETIVSTIFEESEIIRLSLKLLKKSNFNLIQAVEILRKFDEKLKNYPKHYEQSILVSKENRYYDISKKFLKIYLIKK